MYLGKNQHITKTAREVIRKYCLNNDIGREDIADELGIVKGTLNNKLKADPKNCFTVEEVLKLCELTDDDSILKTMCSERGLVVFDPIETMPDGGDLLHEVMMGVLNIDVATGNLSKITKDALENGKVDSQEAESISEALKLLRSIERKLEVTLANREDEE